MPGPADIIETYVTADTLDRELDGWMAEVAPYQWRGAKPLDVATSALLVVDMNKPFVEEGYPLSTPNGRAVLPRIAQTVDAFRRAGRPVIWIIQGHHSVAHDRGDHLSAWWTTPILEGTSDVELPTGLQAHPEEKIIMKRRYSGFYATDLELTLRNLGITAVAICGLITNVCPYTTAFDAFMRDLDVYYLADGTAAFNRDLHVNSLRTIAGWCGYVVRANEVMEWLEG
jgi:nicotinamidase-related amidase